MPITISIGSGKGGVGKTICLANLGLLLAKSGKKVCLVDLDTGGADAHIIFGLFQPEYTLTDFLNRNVESIENVIHSFESLNNLQLIPGTGDTLHSANMSFQEKQRLLRAISKIDADIILFDVGAGTNYHSLDFFMATDIQICIALPEPTSIMDFYTFLQLTTIRKTLSAFLSQSEVSRQIKKNKFDSLNEAFELIEKIQPGAKKKAQESLKYFNPLLIINRVGPDSQLNRKKLHWLSAKYLGIYLPDLGDIPNDEKIPESLKAYLPVVEYAPNSPSSLALQAINQKLLKVIDLYQRKAQKM